MEPTMEAGVETADEVKALGAVVQIDEGKIRAHLDEVVRGWTRRRTICAERGSTSARKGIDGWWGGKMPLER